MILGDIPIKKINELVYKLPKLKVLEIYNTNIKELNIINNDNLDHINCNYNKKVSKIHLECKNLKNLFCRVNHLSEVSIKSDKHLNTDFSQNNLKHFSDKTSFFRELHLSFNNIKNLDLINSPNIIRLNITKNQIINICLEAKLKR